MAPIYYCFNKLRFSKQVVLSLRLYDKEIITLVSFGYRQYHVLGIKNSVLCSPEARIIQFVFPIHDTADTQRHSGNNLYFFIYIFFGQMDNYDRRLFLKLLKH